MSLKLARERLPGRLGWRPEKLGKGELLLKTQSVARSDSICFAALPSAVGGSHLKVWILNDGEMHVVSMGGGRIVDAFIKIAHIDGVTVTRNQTWNIIIELFFSFDAPRLVKKVKHRAVVVHIVREHI